MTSLFKTPKPPKMSMPTPEVPAIPTREDAGDVASMLKKRKGRSNTILAGDLEPLDIGKRSLMG